MAFQGFAISPDTNWNQHTGQGKAYIVYAYATNIAEVAVDTRTGEITVEKIWAAHDVGKAVNPSAVKGQIQGGTLQGLGYCLLEEYRIENGFPLNPDFTSYLIPTAMDTPIIDPIIVEHAYSDGPFGAKGFGEQPLMGVEPAIANAVRDAIGIRFYELPLIPEKIWEALNLDISFVAKT